MTPNRRDFLSQAIAVGLAPAGFAATRPAPVPEPLDPSAAALAIRAEELRQRTGALKKELDEWLHRARTDLDGQAHFSQLKAIEAVLNRFFQRHDALLGQLAAANPTAFLAATDELIRSRFRAQFFWDYFREKFQLRYIPAHKESLWLADTVAWDCYRPVLEEASALGIVGRDEFREPPLCYYSVEFAPGTFVRDSIPDALYRNDFEPLRTPIPVIDLPWDNTTNLWDLVVLAHEVGHNLEADLRLADPLSARLEAVLTAADVPQERRAAWNRWRGEVFADLVAIQLVGPSFNDSIMQVLLRPADRVTQLSTGQRHPPSHARILLNTAYGRTLLRDDTSPVAPAQRAAVDADAARVEDIWRGLYGDPEPLRPFAADAAAVASALMDSPLDALRGSTVRQLIPYAAADDARTRAAARYLRTGVDPPSRLRPRLVSAASRIAADQAAVAGENLPSRLAEIRERTATLIRRNAPPGVRGANDSPAHRRFLESFADPPEGGNHE